MRTENVMYFTEKEEEFANLLIEIGIKENVATVLVFLTNIPEATSREIDRGTDMRQPEVSIAMKYLADKGWIKEHEKSSENKGRPQKVCALAVSMTEIMKCIREEKKKDTKNQLAFIGKIRD
jgi:predicted transcriptional regulator